MNMPMFDELFPSPVFIMMVGLPGSGKSTIANKLAEDNPDTYVFSSDTYRAKICGDENDQSQNELVFDTLYRDLIYHLMDGKNVILDATNISRKDRKRALDRLSHVPLIFRKVAYFVDTAQSECLIRDEKRSRMVGSGVIDKFIRRFEFPQYFEGFDEIVIHSKLNQIKNSYDRDKEKSYLDKMDKFEQNNPHHIHTVGTHCAKLALQIPRTSHYNCIMHEAAWFHDIGKLYTQKFDDKGIAHYYNHDNIGAYIVACNTDILYGVEEWCDVYEAIFFINYHMRAHNDFTSLKAQKKYRTLFGEIRFNKLMEFAEYDRIASGTYEEYKEKK
ncbi:MAG: AAA family ATPase [Acholeplasmatales bacterium]|nr:AAA family ATPase [Acholeplasmatales bacterium]